MENVFRYIEEHIEEDFSNKILAGVAGYSEFHFIKKFKAQANCTPMEYVWRRKLVRASDDIIDGRKIIDVAFQYGFHTQSAFDKAFRRAFGISPSFLKSIRIGIDEMNNKTENMIFMNTIKEGTTKEELLTILKQLLSENKIDFTENTVDTLYSLSCKAYAGKLRYSGEEYVIHPLNVACILAEMEADYKVIMAGLFCDVDQKGAIPLQILKTSLPADIFTLAQEVQDHTADVSSLSENAKLLRLAERLHNMRTLEHISPEKRAVKNKETLTVFLPVARTIGNTKLIDELNNLTMKYA